MNFKKFLGTILSITFLFAFIFNCYATNVNSVNSGDIKVSCFENAVQLHNKATSEDIVADFDVNFSLSASGLHFQGHISDINFNVVANLATTNTNNSCLSYTAIDTYNNYNILYVCVDKETDKLLFLNNFVDNIDDYSNVIKLYMQDKTSGDYIMIEIYISYDFVSNYIENYNITNDEYLSSEMFSWFTKHIESENGTEAINHTLYENALTKEITSSVPKA